MVGQGKGGGMNKESGKKITQRGGTGSGEHGCVKKALRSCTRCRRNKIKCDSMATRPHACTNCARKGAECHIDYVTPPQRSKEMKYLFENVRYVEKKIGGLEDMYVDILGKNGLEIACDDEIRCPTRILKLNGGFVVFCVDIEKDVFSVNNMKMSAMQVEKSFMNFRNMLTFLLEIYFKWENVDQMTFDRAVMYVRELTVENLMERNELLLLLCVLNFYFDIPNINYLDNFNYVIESYCRNASCGAEGDLNVDEDVLSKDLLAKLIVGNVSNGSVQFHSELFIKNFTMYLFVHIVLYGPEFFMDCFMEKYIGTLESVRKKINFDKNWEVKWVNFYIRLFNLIECKVCPETEEIEDILSQIEKEKESYGSLECAISLIKLDQYIVGMKIIETKDRIFKGLLFVFEKLAKDLDFLIGRNDSEVEGERICFIQMFFHQLFSLNEILCVNSCKIDLKCPFVFNGFNYENSNLYEIQRKSNYVGKVLVSEKGIFSMMEYLGLGISKHSSNIDEETSIVNIVEQDLKNYGLGHNSSLNILKSSCRLIWDLYEKVVFWDMFDKVFVHCPFAWNAKVLLRYNGLSCECEDDRSKGRSVIRGKEMKGKDFEHSNVKSRSCKNGVVKYKVENDCSFVEESGSEGGENFTYFKEARNFVKVPGIPEKIEDQLRGGINQILKDVDWVKESADDVLRKIHGVIN